MNYLLEINAFERRMRRAPLSSNAQLLWYKLMQFCNGLRWAEEFQVDNDRLLELLNVKSFHTLNAARKELQEDGLITFAPGKKGTPSTYHMVSVADLEGPDLSFLDEEPDEGAFLCAVKEDITTYYGYTEALEKELNTTAALLWDEYLPGKKPTKTDVQKIFFCIKQQVRREDESWEMTFPESKKEMLALAFKIAQENGTVRWNYIEGIFRNWRLRGVQTVEEVEIAEIERDQRMGRL